MRESKPTILAGLCATEVKRIHNIGGWYRTFKQLKQFKIKIKTSATTVQIYDVCKHDQGTWFPL